MKPGIFHILIICIILLSINPVFCLSALGTETISIGSVEINTGTTVTIPVTIADATDVEGIRLDIIYNQDVVMILDITPDDSFPQSSITTNTDNPGFTTIVLTNANYITAASATPLIDITFQAQTAGYSPLELTNVELTKDFNPYDPGTVNNGEIRINSDLYGYTHTDTTKTGTLAGTLKDESGFANDTNASAGGGEGIAPEPITGVETTTKVAHEQTTNQTESDEKTETPGFGVLLSLLVLLITVKRGY
jgi:hypothetical protein